VNHLRRKRVRNITLQDDEADALEELLDSLLIAGEISEGELRRKVRRISKKLFWAKSEAERCKAA
jgi:uncharacterized membrane protein